MFALSRLSSRTLLLLICEILFDEFSYFIIPPKNDPIQTLPFLSPVNVMILLDFNLLYFEDML